MRGPLIKLLRAETVCMALSSSPAASGLPASLSFHLTNSFASVLPECHERRAATLVEELAALAPVDRRSAYCHHQGERMVRALELDAPLRCSLLSGEKSVAEVLSELDGSSRSAKAMFDAIQGHHHRLRMLVSGDGKTATDEWSMAVVNQDELRQYARAASEISTREWTQQGIDWCASEAVSFFRKGGMARLLRKEALRKGRGTSLLPQSEKDVIAAAVATYASSPLELLDIGSCGSLFDDMRLRDRVSVTALDLCPSETSPGVYQCDFLGLEVRGPPSPPVPRCGAPHSAWGCPVPPAAPHIALCPFPPSMPCLPTALPPTTYLRCAGWSAWIGVAHKPSSASPGGCH